MQPQPHVLDADRPAARVGKERQYAGLVRRVELADDLFLVAEVIVEIARADAHLVGDVRRRDVWRPGPVEQGEARLEDAFAGAAGAFPFRHGGRAGEVTRAV